MCTQKRTFVAISMFGMAALASVGAIATFGQENSKPSVAKESRARTESDPKEKPQDATAPVPLKIPKELLEKRLEAARSAFTLNLKRVRGGVGPFSELFVRRLSECEVYGRDAN